MFVNSNFPLRSRFQITCGYKSKTLEERLGIPARPKKPLTPYFRFMRDIRATVVASDPKLSANDVVKKMALKWETVDEKQKKKYQDEYKKEQVNCDYMFVHLV